MSEAFLSTPSSGSPRHIPASVVWESHLELLSFVDITSEAEELCSKPQEEAKVPTTPTLELECVSANGLTNEQVR